MTFVVPFDGSDLAEAALVRAVEFGTVLDERVLAVSVVPKENTEYARRKGWLEPNEHYDRTKIVSRLHEQVTDLAPSADFTHELVDRFATSGTIAIRLRKVAKQADASLVFIGSASAGNLVSSLTSVGGSVASDPGYDVVIVRDATPAKIEKIRKQSPYRAPKSDFYLPE